MTRTMTNRRPLIHVPGRSLDHRDHAARGVPCGGPTQICVGVWDLVGEVPELADILELLDAAQDTYRFVEILAALPTGTVASAEQVRGWARKHTREISSEALEHVGANLVARDFFPRADRIRSDLGLDWVATITPSWILAEPQHDEVGELPWNRSAVFMAGAFVISTRDLRRHAREAECPLELAVALLLVASALIASEPDLRFASSRDDLFDLCSRGGHEPAWEIGPLLCRPSISRASLAEIRPERRSSVQALIEVLADYRRDE